MTENTFDPKEQRLYFIESRMILKGTTLEEAETQQQAIREALTEVYNRFRPSIKFSADSLLSIKVSKEDFQTLGTIAAFGKRAERVVNNREQTK